MKGLPLILIASLLFITSSCKHVDSKEDLSIDQNIKQIVFFTDDQAYKQEASYYDAIIELKKEFPTEIKNMKIIQAKNANHYFEAFNIKSCPAILLIYQDRVLVKINGVVSKDQIVQPIASALK